MRLFQKKEIPLQSSAPVLFDTEHWTRISPLIFYLLLAALGLVWVLLGNTWYSRVLPFYDSLSYQTRVEAIISAYRTNGWGAFSDLGLRGPNSFLYVPLTVAVAAFLPLSRTTLYIYLIPIHLIALGVLFHFIRRKTSSWSLSFLGPLIYLSTTPFGILRSGILDQRLDLSTASFSLILWVTGIDWAENATSTKKTVILGITSALAFMHRPMISVQVSLVVIMIILYALWMARKENNEKRMLQSLGLAAFVAGVLSIPWFMTNLKQFYNYYVTSSPITGASPIMATVPAYTRYVRYWIGADVLILVGILLVAAFISRRFSGKYFLLSIGTIILPLVPLVLSGSDSSVVTQICLAGMGLLPLSFVSQKHYPGFFRFAAVLVAMVMAFSNLATLAKSVNSVDPKERLQVETMITRLVQEYPTEKRVFLSGFISAGGGPDAIASIARMDFGYPLKSGAALFHPVQFGLSAKSTRFSDEELEKAAAYGLQRAYKVGGFIMLVEPSRIEEKNIQAWLSRHVFSNQLASHMDRIARASGRLEDTGISGTIGIIPVRFYVIRPE